MSTTAKTTPVGPVNLATRPEPVTEEMLLHRAEAAAAQAYAPYSHIHIGAALLTVAGNVFDGCNVENASYGLTWCAERTAVVTAVAAEGGNDMEISMVAIWTDDLPQCPPCGACRQVLAEFGINAQVIYQSRDGITRHRVAELLPDHFSTP